FDEELIHRDAVPERGAEVAVKSGLEEREELLDQRLVAAVLVPDLLQLSRSLEPPPGQRARRVARDHPEQEEVDDHDEEETAKGPETLRGDETGVGAPPGDRRCGGVSGDRRHGDEVTRARRQWTAAGTPRSHRPR